MSEISCLYVRLPNWVGDVCMSLPSLRALQASGLPQPTVHRLLKQLIAGGLLTQDQAKRYRLGHFAYELGLSASSHYGLKELGMPYVRAVALITGDTAFLTIRSGEDSFCLERAEGVYPIKVLPVEVGHRRPMGIGGGGLALLAFLPLREREQVLQKIEPQLANYSGLSAPILRTLVEQTLSHGYSVISNYAVAGVTSIGYPIFDRYGSIVAAISVSGIAPRMNNERQAMIVACLKKECEALQRKLWNAAA